MSALSALNLTQRFRHLARRLGVVDIRCSASECVLLVAARDTDDERLDAIRIFARAEWPNRTVIVSRKSDVRESGVFRGPDLSEQSNDNAGPGDPER